MREYGLRVDGLDVTAIFGGETVSGVLLPLLRRLTEMHRRMGRRLVVYLAAPPGCGKSTLAAFLERLSLQTEGIEPLQWLGIDGFHYPQEYVLSHTVDRNGSEVPMKDVKGCPESFDATRLRSALAALKRTDIPWPSYDRRLHDVAEDAVEVKREIALVEGNWLLLGEGIWAGLGELCDFSVMMLADAGLLKDRLIGRKVRGGLTPDEALKFYETGDGPNVLRCLGYSAPADLSLIVHSDGVITANDPISTTI